MGLRILRGLALGADVALLLLFGIGYAARHLPPTYAWWAELIATALPFVTILLAGATLVTLLTGRWRLFVLHLCCLALAVIRFVPGTLLEAAPVEENGLSLLTFNTSRGPGMSAEAQGQALTDLLRTMRPDVACFQDLNLHYDEVPEVQPATQLSVPADSLGYTVVGPQDSSEAVQAWQPVLVRTPVTQHGQHLLRDEEGRVLTRVVRVRFSWEGREAVLYNLHLRSFGAQKPWAEGQFDPFTLAFWRHYVQQYRAAYLDRAREVVAIRQMLDRETLPVILCGDFNSTPHNWTFQHLAQDMIDVFREQGAAWGATYHARLPFARIDHVLVSPEWKPLAARVDSSPISDHRPLSVRLRWREPPGVGHRGNEATTRREAAADSGAAAGSGSTVDTGTSRLE